LQSLTVRVIAESPAATGLNSKEAPHKTHYCTYGFFLGNLDQGFAGSTFGFLVFGLAFELMFPGRNE